MIHPKHMFLLEDGAKQPLPEHHTCLFTSRDPTWPTAAPTSLMLSSMYAGEAIWNAYVHNMVSPINKHSLRDQRLHPSLLENPGKHALSHPGWKEWARGEGFLTRPNRDLANRTSQVSPSSWEPEEPGAPVGMMKTGLKVESGGGKIGERRNCQTDSPGLFTGTEYFLNNTDKRRTYKQQPHP